MRSYDPRLIQEPTIYRYFALPIYPSSSVLFLNVSKLVFFLQKKKIFYWVFVFRVNFRFCRLNEAVMHFGESIKEIINEEFGDGM